jgi:hypothetical protein
LHPAIFKQIVGLAAAPVYIIHPGYLVAEIFVEIPEISPRVTADFQKLEILLPGKIPEKEAVQIAEITPPGIERQAAERK